MLVYLKPKTALPLKWGHQPVTPTTF